MYLYQTLQYTNRICSYPNAVYLGLDVSKSSRNGIFVCCGVSLNCMLNLLRRQVVDLNCPDADIGDTVTYAILSGNTANVFSLDVNGVLKTATRELKNIT